VAFPDGPTDSLDSLRMQELADQVDWIRKHVGIAKPTELGQFLGYDITGAIPNSHTALFYKRIVEGFPEFRRALNENGLAREASAARSLMKLANEGERLPHCVVGVWASEKSPALSTPTAFSASKATIHPAQFPR
jgi:hypothetical protein